MFDSHANFGYSNVAVAPVPANSGTSLQVAAGQGALFPAAPFNCTVWPAGVQPLASNAEIVRVTAVVGDVLTITRAQEGTAAVNIDVGFQIANTTSRKVFTDIENAVVISAGTQAATGPFTFADGNGVTFGMDNGTVTASVAPVPSFIPGFSASNGSSTYAAVLTFVNSNGISFINTNGSLAASHNGITSQSNQAFSASGGSSAFQTLEFANSNGLTFSNSNGSVIASYTVPSTAGLISFINFSAGTTSSNLASVTFGNANGISFQYSNGSIVASYVPGAGASVNFSAGATSANLSAVTFANSNGVTFGLTNGTITASVNTSVAPTLASFWQNEAAFQINTIFGLDNSSQRGCNVFLPYNISVAYARIPIGVSHNVTLPAALAGGINGSVQNLSTWAVFVYTQGTGASSSNYNLYASGANRMTVLNSVSAAAATSNSHSYTQRITLQVQGSQFTYENTYTASGANYQFGSSAFLSSFSGQRYLDIDLATSMSFGNYLILFALSTSTAVNSTQISGASVVAPNYTGWFGNRNDTQFVFTQMASIQNSSVGTHLGWGVALPVSASSTLDPVPITSLQPLNSGHRPIIQFARTV